MNSNLSPVASFTFETLSQQWQEATRIEENSYRLIHVRAYRMSALPTRGATRPSIHRAAETVLHRKLKGSKGVRLALVVMLSRLLSRRGSTQVGASVRARDVSLKHAVG
jgi:hypothetical protein